MGCGVGFHPSGGLVEMGEGILGRCGDGGDGGMGGLPAGSSLAFPRSVNASLPLLLRTPTPAEADATGWRGGEWGGGEGRGTGGGEWSYE